MLFKDVTPMPMARLLVPPTMPVTIGEPIVRLPVPIVGVGIIGINVSVSPLAPAVAVADNVMDDELSTETTVVPGGT
jgi:hypothetical protein